MVPEATNWCKYRIREVKMSTTFDGDKNEPKETSFNHLLPPKENEIKHNIISVKKRGQFFAVAETAAAQVLRSKGLYDIAYDMRPVHTYGYNFRVKFFDGNKLKHDVLVKMDVNLQVLSTRLDYNAS